MTWSGIKGFGRDALLALAIAFAAWFLWIQMMVPAPVSAGPAPDFELADLTGQTVALAGHDEVVVLNFWFTGCPPCRHEIPQLAAFHAANPDVALYGVSVDGFDPRRLEALSKKLGVTYPVLHDRRGKVATAYGISLYPTTVVIVDGEIRDVRTGEITRSTLESMVAGVR